MFSGHYLSDKHCYKIIIIMTTKTETINIILSENNRIYYNLKMKYDSIIRVQTRRLISHYYDNKNKKKKRDNRSNEKVMTNNRDGIRKCPKSTT